MKKNHLNYLLHILGVILFLSLSISSSTYLSFSFWKTNAFQQHLLNCCLLLSFFYCNYLFLVPKYYYSGRRFLYYISCALWLLLILYGPLIIPGKSNNSFFVPHAGHIFQFIVVLFLSLLLNLNNTRSKIENNKLITEIYYLRRQINPHFLFNTLNAIYSLVLVKSDKAADAVVKLSGLMRYVAGESKHEDVPLYKELEYIQNYIGLQRLRIDDSAALNFTIAGNPSGKNIPPLLLMPFIENALLYGINPEGISVISVHIEITDNEFIFNVKTNKHSIVIPENLKIEKGIESIKIRLIDRYPEMHSLAIYDTEKTYEVVLKIIYI